VNSEWNSTIKWVHGVSTFKNSWNLADIHVDFTVVYTLEEIRKNSVWKFTFQDVSNLFVGLILWSDLLVTSELWQANLSRRLMSQNLGLYPALQLAVTTVTQLTHSPQVARAEIVKVEVYFYSGQSWRFF